MASGVVMEVVDGVTRIEFGLFGVGVPAPLEHLHAQRAEEALRHGVVPTVALATHARDQAVLGQEGPAIPARIRGSAIGVMHQSRSRPSSVKRSSQRLRGEGRFVVIAHRPPDHPSRVAIHHHREVNPAGTCRNRRGIADPHPIWSGGRDLSTDENRGDRSATAGTVVLLKTRGLQAAIRRSLMNLATRFPPTATSPHSSAIDLNGTSQVIESKPSTTRGDY